MTLLHRGWPIKMWIRCLSREAGIDPMIIDLLLDHSIRVVTSKILATYQPKAFQEGVYAAWPIGTNCGWPDGFVTRLQVPNLSHTPASVLFYQHILQNHLGETQISNQFLQSQIIVFQLPHMLQPGGINALVFLASGSKKPQKFPLRGRRLWRFVRLK